MKQCLILTLNQCSWLSPCQNSQGWCSPTSKWARCICLIASAGNPGEDQSSSCQGMPFVSISRAVGMLPRGSCAQMAGWESSRCACDPRCWWRGRGGKHIMHAFHLWDTLFIYVSVRMYSKKSNICIHMYGHPPRSTQVIFWWYLQYKMHFFSIYI